MIDSLGLLEVYGLVAGIDAADAMLKSSNVRILNYETTIPGMITLVVEGDLASCRAAIDAGVAAALRSGKVIGHKVIGRPDGDTEWLVSGFSGVSHKIAPQPSAPEPTVLERPDEAEMLAYIASVQNRYGASASEAAMHFSCPIEQSRKILERLLSQGKLRKRSSRYRIKAGGNGNG